MKLCPHRGFCVPDGAKECPYHGMPVNDQRGWFDSGRLFNVGVFEESTFDNHDDECGECFQTIFTEVQAPVSLWMQNTMDWRHVPTVHGSGFERQFDTTLPFDVQISPDGERSSHKLWVKPHIHESFIRLIGKDKARPWFHHALAYPTVSVTSFCGALYSVETVRQLNLSDRCRVTTRYFVRKDAKLPKMLLDMAIEANKQILDEDRRAVEQWARTHKPGVHDRNWLAGEERIKSYVSVCSRHREG